MSITATVEADELVIGQPQCVRLRVRNDGQATVTSLVLRLCIPAGFDLLEGSPRLDVPRLLPGQSHEVGLRVLPHVLGQASLTSNNFTYRDGWGRPQRVTGWNCGLNVVKHDIPAAQGELRVGTAHTLSRDAWDKLGGSFVNTGSVALMRVRIELQGPLESKLVELGKVAAGEARFVQFNIRARETGAVPITVAMSGMDEYARTFAWTQLAEMHVDVRGTSRAILFLAAQPTELEVLRLGKELKSIREKLGLDAARNRLVLTDRQAVRRSELSRELLTTPAQIVHFSGHVTRRGELCFEGEHGEPEPATPEAVAKLFSLLDTPVECVVLNACFTDGLADALSPHVPYVVGARGDLDDEAAFAFSSGFYQALALGKTIEHAFALGCAEAQLDPDMSRLAFVLRVRGARGTAV